MKWMIDMFVKSYNSYFLIFLDEFEYQIIFQLSSRPMSYMDDFIHRLNMIPPQADTLLRHIRNLDKEVQQIKLQLQSKRTHFINHLHVNHRKNSRARNQLDQQFQQIVQMENQIQGKSKEKVGIAQRLYNLIHQPTEKLEKQLRQRGLDKNFQEDGGLKKKRGKKPARKGLKRSEWEVDTNQPRYCYCRGHSFGQMVMCQNTYCEKEWFHIGCINQKKLPEKWFCKDCRTTETTSPKKNRTK